MKKMIVFALASILSATAFGSGSTSCVVDNKDVKIEVSLANGTLFGNPVIANSSVSVSIKRNALVIGITEYTFQKTMEVNEIPYWFNIGNELKLGAYAEPETDRDGNPIDAFVTIAVVIDAKANRKKDAFVGTYKVIQASNTAGAGHMEKAFTGKIKCTVE